jgi:hypothetical protein
MAVSPSPCAAASSVPCNRNGVEFFLSDFNSTLIHGNVTHHECIQAGEGHDGGLNQEKGMMAILIKFLFEMKWLAEISV